MGIFRFVHTQRIKKFQRIMNGKKQRLKLHYIETFTTFAERKGRL